MPCLTLPHYTGLPTLLAQSIECLSNSILTFLLNELRLETCVPKRPLIVFSLQNGRHGIN